MEITDIFSPNSRSEGDAEAEPGVVSHEDQHQAVGEPHLHRQQGVKRFIVCYRGCDRSNQRMKLKVWCICKAVSNLWIWLKSAYSSEANSASIYERRCETVFSFTWINCRRVCKRCPLARRLVCIILT